MRRKRLVCLIMLADMNPVQGSNPDFPILKRIPIVYQGDTRLEIPGQLSNLVVDGAN